MATLESPATLADAAACLGRCDPLVWAVVKVQLRAGPSWVLRDGDGRSLIVGGIFPSADGREAWFLPAPASARHMTGLRLVRLTLARPEYRGIRAAVSTPAGARIARLLGLRPTGAIDGVEWWEIPWAGW